MIDHQDQVVHASRLTPAQLAEATCDETVQLIDVRNAGEVEGTGLIPGATNIPLAQLSRRLDEIDPAKPVVLYCAGGWRSSVGASLLRNRGYGDVSDVLGGFAGWHAVQPVA
jgi:rhodanese-related sulfurtransferase